MLSQCDSSLAWGVRLLADVHQVPRGRDEPLPLPPTRSPGQQMHRGFDKASMSVSWVVKELDFFLMLVVVCHVRRMRHCEDAAPRRAM